LIGQQLEARECFVSSSLLVSDLDSGPRDLEFRTRTNWTSLCDDGSGAGV